MHAIFALYNPSSSYGQFHIGNSAESLVKIIRRRVEDFKLKSWMIDAPIQSLINTVSSLKNTVQIYNEFNVSRVLIVALTASSCE